MSETRAGKPLDLRGIPCAFVLAELDRALGEHGGAVEILCDHPTTIHETVPEYCRSHGYKLEVRPEIYPLDSQAYRLRITRYSRGGRSGGGV